jgi:hypothetical protein
METLLSIQIMSNGGKIIFTLILTSLLMYLLGFKSECLNSEHVRMNAKVKDVKVQESESKMGESSNKSFHFVR